MVEKLFPRWSLICYMLLVYAFYPISHLTITPKAQTLYQHLTESFLSGQLSLNISPSPDLLNLPNPYDPSQNKASRLYDASLYKDKYYLYFGPLPVITFYLPFKCLTGVYPSDSFAAFFFLSLGFLFSYFLIINLKERYFPHVSEFQLGFMGALLGFTNGSLFLLSRPYVYEVAIASAFCWMSMALFFLYQLIHHARTKDIALFSLCLSLSVAGRPHFVLGCLFLLLGLFIYILTYHNRRLVHLVALLLPAATVGFLLALYNDLRFESIFDFGHRWQLSCNDIQALHQELGEFKKIPRNMLSFLYVPWLVHGIHRCYIEMPEKGISVTLA